MELDVKNLSSDELYDILVDWVAPRPIAWVSKRVLLIWLPSVFLTWSATNHPF